MSGLDRQARIAQLMEAFGRAALGVVICGEGWEAVVVETAGEVGDVGAKDEISIVPAVAGGSYSALWGGGG